MTTSITSTDRPCAVCGIQNHPHRRVWPRTRPVTIDLCDRCEYEHPEFQTPRGRVCSFDRHQTMADVIACPDCIAAQKAESDRIQASETIDPTQEYGQHIALTCVNHQDLRWSTKNIGWIGARSIFYSGRFDGPAECNCSIRDLIVVAS